MTYIECAAGEYKNLWERDQITYSGLLLEVATKRNALSLPVPKQSGGLRLPPDRYCLTATNYRLKPSKKRGPGNAKSHAFSGNQGGYGANYSINRYIRETY